MTLVMLVEGTGEPLEMTLVILVEGHGKPLE